MLPSWGARPGEAADPSKYLEKGYPAKGRYRLFEGFGGWWPGKIPARDIAERYGDISPGEFNAGFVARVGGDLRLAGWSPWSTDADGAVFPMQGELYGMVRPFEPLTVYGSVGLASSRSRLDVSPNDAKFGYDDALSYLALREWFVKLDRLPYNSMVRAGRFSPGYGWRIADHTSFVRRDLGFDQNRQVFGVEASTNPNYPFVVGSAFVEGLDGWPGDLCNGAGAECPQAGRGAAVTGGVRELGYQLFGSVLAVQRDTGPDEVTAGLSWGVAWYPLVYLGEMDYRRQTPGGDLDPTNGLFAYHELDLLVARGVNLKLKYDWRDPSLHYRFDEVYRLTGGVEWHPWTFVHIEAQHRTAMSVMDGALGVASHELLLITHAWC